MKKYFTKYLPVEGNVKPGDYWSSTAGIFHLVKDQEHADKINKKKSEETRNPNWYSKGKLFLCSRDIQVGDEMYSGRTNKSLGVPDTLPDSNICIKNDWFKVIGEISPDAIWVKEGDEFDEDELEPFLFYSKHPDESIYMDTIFNLEEWKKLNPDNKQNRYVPIIEIKCPTCKQFH